MRMREANHYAEARRVGSRQLWRARCATCGDIAVNRVTQALAEYDAQQHIERMTEAAAAPPQEETQP
jgi:hypothetical protein